jgi:ribosome-associated toxin RatA of RatAB toxin-antitoxin module
MNSWHIADKKLDFSISRSVVAPKEQVYRVLADMEAYPEFINDLVSVKRTGNLYHFVARAAILTVRATLMVTHTPHRLIAFELVEGPIERLTGHWLVEEGERPEQTKVTLTIQAESGRAGMWLLRMTAKFIENKSDKFIGAFINRVMAVKAKERDGPPSLPARDQDQVESREGSSQDPAGPTPPTGLAPALFETEAQRQTLEMLAATIIPADEFDTGVQHSDLAGMIEMRARYEAGRAELYQAALVAVDRMAQAMFNWPRFIDLAAPERLALMETIRQNGANIDFWGQVKPAAFFNALWEDVVFLYCTQPETWERIGFPGPSFDKGGYPDVDQPQIFREMP